MYKWRSVRFSTLRENPSEEYDYDNLLLLKLQKQVTEKPFTSKWKKGDVGMAKHFSKKYGNKRWAFDYPYLQSQINFCSVRMPVNAWCYIPTSLPPEPSYIVLSWVQLGHWTLTELY